MNSTVVWIITAMLWYQGPGDYGYTNYEAQQFDGRSETPLVFLFLFFSKLSW
jgi:hypothetical protein